MHLFILAAVTLAFTYREVENARACLRLTTTLPSSVPYAISLAALDKPELENAKLQDKMMTDMFEYCRKHISDEETHQIKTSLGNYEYEDYKHLLPIEPDKYQTPEDLVIAKEHYQLRNIILKTEKKIKLGMRPDEL